MLKIKRGLSIQFKKEDAWIGVYWDKENIWICIIPCFPIWIIRKLTKRRA